MSYGENEVMREEIRVPNENQTWDLVPKSSDVRPISCKLVYKVKTRPYECWDFLISCFLDLSDSHNIFI